MLGQAHTPRRRLASLAAIAAVVLIVPAVGIANASHGTAASLRARNATIAAESRAAVLDLYSLDRRLATSRSRLGSLAAEAAELRAQRASLTHQTAIARRSARIGETQLAQRLRLLYEQGNVEPLEIVFGSRSLDDALTSIDNLSRASGDAEDVLRQLESARRALAVATQELSSRQSALARAAAQARATAAALAATQTARSSYLSSLAEQRRLNDAQISTLVAQAQAAERRSREVGRTTAADSAPAAVPPPLAAVATGGSAITVTATGYSLAGRTATGLPVGWGVVAVDPSVIPLGTHMTIPGYGEAVAADTGGAVAGAAIDLWFPSVAQANAWGRRSVTIHLR